MRIVFFGTPELAVPSLAALADAHDVTALVCQPDKPQGRSKTPVRPPTKVLAEARGIPVVQPTKLNDGTFEAWLREQAPDVCALVAYGRILKQPILDVPRHGFLNVHPSALPKYRGPSPIQTAILNGDATTAISIMALDAGMDTGPVLLQKPFPINPDDTTATLTERIAARGAELLVEGVRRVESGDAVFTPQADAGVTVTTMFTKDDGKIRWASPAAVIHNLVRAAVPWPVAHCGFRGEVYRFHKTRVIDASGAPGEVVSAGKDHLHVAAGEDGLAIELIQAPGKKAMAIADFMRGARVESGERFEDL